MARTKGATNVSSFSFQHPSRCTCGSTNRTEYTNRQWQECVTTVQEKPVTHIERHNTTCADCGQRRIDTTFHNLPALIGQPDPQKVISQVTKAAKPAAPAKRPKTRPPTKRRR